MIRHITKEDDDDSEELPEVDLEPSESAEEVQDEEVVADDEMEVEDGEEQEEDVVEVMEDDEEEEEEDEDVKLVNGEDRKMAITKDDKGNEILPDGKFQLWNTMTSVWT